MAQPISDQVGFLSEACRAVQELSASKNSLDNIRLEKKRLEKELEAERRAVADAISQTVKKRKEEVNSSYDKEIAKAQDCLKRVRSKRERAKSQGVKERIDEETVELCDENRELKLKLKTLFQQERVPRFCKSTWYYALYYTRGGSEYAILLLTVLICFLAIPCGVFALVSVKSIYCLIGIYFAVVVLFGGCYVLINNKTKVRHQEALKQGRRIRDLMRMNKKKIGVITNSIRHDRDEAVYNLEKYDDEIAWAEQGLTDIANKKKEALNAFEKVTRTIISDEIASGSRDKVKNLEERLRHASKDAKEAEEKVKVQTLFITDNYESYLGTEFMVPEKLDELADYIRLGKASTISEAQALYKSAKG